MVTVQWGDLLQPFIADHAVASQVQLPKTGPKLHPFPAATNCRKSSDGTIGMRMLLEQFVLHFELHPFDHILCQLEDEVCATCLRRLVGHSSDCWW